jgi:hypothetical protein
MRLSRPVTAFAVVTSLAVGGHAAASIRGVSRSDRVQPSKESPVQLDPVLANAAYANSGGEPLSVEKRLRRDVPVFLQAYADFKWRSAYAHNLQLAAAELARRQAAVEGRRHRRAEVPRQQPSTAPEVGSGRCGGDLPSCYVMNRESRGNIRAENPVSTASGKWQILDSTWNGFMGYTHAADAPEWVQDAKARTIAACNWEPPNYCAG